jgi:hypothetical protein
MQIFVKKCLALLFALAVLTLPLEARASDGPVTHRLSVKIQLKSPSVTVWHEGKRMPVKAKVGDKVRVEFRYIDQRDSGHSFKIAKIGKDGMVDEIAQTPLILKVHNNPYVYEFTVTEDARGYSTYCHIPCAGMDKMTFEKKLVSKVIREDCD